MKKIILFLGSGITYPSGQPNMKDITESVLSESWYRELDENNYFKMTKNRVELTDIDAITLFPKILKIINEHANQYFSDIYKKANYEDFYNLVYKINMIKRNSYFDIPEKLYFNEITEDINKILPSSIDSNFKINFYEYIYEYIDEIVFHKLAGKKNPQKMDFISELCEDILFDRVNIATLNIDILIEKYLCINNILYHDGFYNYIRVNETKYWSFMKFTEDNSRVKLFKLHGSLNYYLGLKNDNDNKYLLEMNPVYLVNNFDEMEEEFRNNLGLVKMANGTYNKLIYYGSGYYNQILCCFENELYRTNKLIVSGYGWGDFGINQRIITWLNDNIENKMYVLQEKFIESIEMTNGYFKKRIKEMIGLGKVVDCKNYLCNTDYYVFRNQYLI